MTRSLDDGATRDVSACERLILIIRYVYYQHEKGDLATKKEVIRWDEIDRLRADCDVLPADFQAMMDVIETYR